jgi:hypothetical protein
MIAAVVGLLFTLMPGLSGAVAPLNTDQVAAVSRATPRVEVTTLDNGDTRTYVARVLDANNKLVTNASLDISAMTDNPDVRIGTEAMTPVPGVAGSFQRTLSFPAAGDWVLVIRVHDPISFVHLLTERVDSDSLPSANSHIETPSRQHLRELAPDFTARYDPIHGIGSTDPQPLLAAQTAATSAASHQHAGESTQATGAPADGPIWKWVWAVVCTAIAALAIRNATSGRQREADSQPGRNIFGTLRFQSASSGPRILR